MSQKDDFELQREANRRQSDMMDALFPVPGDEGLRLLEWVKADTEARKQQFAEVYELERLWRL